MVPLQTEEPVKQKKSKVKKVIEPVVEDYSNAQPIMSFGDLLGEDDAD